MANGIGCECAARCESECSCDGVDWRDEKEVELEQLLTADKFESKDWKDLDIVGRVEWLLARYKIRSQELNNLVKVLEEVVEEREDLFKAVSHLPIDQFVSEECDGAVFVDWNKIDASDFKDNADKFAKSMIEIKSVLSKRKE